MTKTCEDFKLRAVQRCGNLVDLEKCCKMSIWTQRSALIQPRTSPPKFVFICHYFVLIWSLLLQHYNGHFIGLVLGCIDASDSEKWLSSWLAGQLAAQLAAQLDEELAEQACAEAARAAAEAETRQQLHAKLQPPRHITLF